MSTSNAPAASAPPAALHLGLFDRGALAQRVLAHLLDAPDLPLATLHVVDGPHVEAASEALATKRPTATLIVHSDGQQAADDRWQRCSAVVLAPDGDPAPSAQVLLAANQTALATNTVLIPLLATGQGWQVGPRVRPA
ncbi:MAG: hypothetical protein AAF772_05915, partial [Acidobacteriota bacterium]